MGRWQTLAIMAALAVAALPVLGQGEMQPPDPQMPQLPTDTAELYDEVQVLRTLHTLELSEEQFAELLAINARVIREREQLAALRKTTWAEYEDEIEAVLNAWMTGQTPSSRAKRIADRAVNQVNAAQSAFQSARWSATEALYDALTGAQRKLVESPGVAEERSARTARMGGVDSVGQYVLTELDATRDLMPDEFNMLAATEAGRIAETLVGSNAANLAQMRDLVFDVLVEVYQWTPERYQQQRETLPGEIVVALGFEAVEQRAPVSWTELMRVAGSTRTPAAVNAIAPAGGDEVE